MDWLYILMPIAGVKIFWPGLIILGIGVGIIGGFLGGFLLPMVGLSFGGTVGFLITAFIGAVVLLLIVNLFTRGRAR